MTDTIKIKQNLWLTTSKNRTLLQECYIKTTTKTADIFLIA